LRTEAKGPLVLTDGSFRFLLGVNYWPRGSNIMMWRRWDEGAIAEDINMMRYLGVRAARVFLLDEDWVTPTGDVRGEQLGRLRWLLDRLGDNGMAGFVTLLVGHMSGRNWAVPWAPDNDIYSSRGVEGTARFASAVASAMKGSGGLGGWVLSNEMSLLRRPPSQEAQLSLVRALVQALRSADGEHVIGSGDVADSYAQRPTLVRGLVDYVGLHLYLYDSDPVRHGFSYSGMIELFSDDGQVPVILEEFGFSSLQFSEQDRAAFIYEVLYSALAHGASGAMVWCFSDFPAEGEPPYEWRNLELGFGLVGRDGRPKPSAESFRRFAGELGRLEALGVHARLRRVSRALVLSPFYVLGDYQFTDYRGALGGLLQAAKSVLVAHQLLTAAGAQASVRHEPELEPSDPRRLIVVPSAVSGLATTWRKLLEYVEAGGTLYASLLRGVGGVRFVHESGTQLWQELFGVEPALRVGSPGVKLAGRLSLRLERPLGDLREGWEAAFDVEEPIYAYSVRPVDADVIATVNGEPAVFIARRGKGSAILSTFPVEAALAYSEVVGDWRPYADLYHALVVESGVEALRPSDPRVEVQELRGDGQSLVIAVSHWPGELSVELPISGASLVAGNAALEGSGPVKLRMPPRGAAALLVGEP
jgi:endo-1,4-beta-mannosidase